MRLAYPNEMSQSIGLDSTTLFMMSRRELQEYKSDTFVFEYKMKMQIYSKKTIPKE